MRDRQGSLREELIIAGIDEINENGVSGFSIRNVAKACGVSCAAPYRHFESKQDFISAIIDYVNDLWALRQAEVLETCGTTKQEKLVQICLSFIRFLMEKPIYRNILMLHDEGYNNLYHKKQTPIGSLTQALQAEIFEEFGIDEETWLRKLLTVRALVFGVITLFEAGEFRYNEENMKRIEFVINREFEIE